MATWRRVRSHRCLCSKRNVVPCSLGEIGIIGAGAQRLEAARPTSSTPPGDRGSSRTMPVTATLASWVSAPNAAQVVFRHLFPGQDPLHGARAVPQYQERDLAARPGRHDPAAHGDRLAHVRAQLADPYRRHARSAVKRGVSQGALSLALLLGGVNAACGADAGIACRSSRRSRSPARPRSRCGAPRPAGGSPAGWSSRARPSTAGSVDRKVYAVDLGSGQTRWSSRLGGLIGGGVLVAGDTVYAASSRPEGRVYALDARTGRRLWRTTTGPVGAPLALIDGMLVAETQRGEVIGLAPGDRSRALAAEGGVRPDPGRAGGQRHPDRGHRRLALPAARGRRQGRPRRPRSPGTILSPWLEHRRRARGRHRPIPW